MSNPGYYRFPTIHRNTIVFVSEDDLWSVPTTGGPARRLTAALAEVSHPLISPDGKHIAFIGREDGPVEVYTMPISGGPPTRLTFESAAQCRIAAWSPDSKTIIYASSVGQPFAGLTKLWSVDRLGGLPQQTHYGPAQNISFGPSNKIILGRNTRDPARWKRYRGGTWGRLWIDAKGDGQFHKFVDNLNGNLASPLFLGSRVYFLSDHQGVGNLYSATPSGKSLRRETNHLEFYARHATTDGKRIVYHAGADIYLHDPKTQSSTRVKIDYASPRTQRSRKYADPSSHIESAALHPKGHALALTARGKVFSFESFESPVIQHAPDSTGRLRLAKWLSDGKRLLAVSDDSGEEQLVIFKADGTSSQTRLPRLKIGRVLNLLPSPTQDKAALTNHRGELIEVDLKTRKRRLLDKSQHGRINGIDYSPDGKWIAYGFPNTDRTTVIKLCRLSNGSTTEVTQPVLHDIQPSFDPAGKFLYFLSYRVFDPVYDNLHFDLGFPRGMKPYLLTLAKDTVSPFISGMGAMGAAEDNGKDDDDSEKDDKDKTPDVKVDLDGIQNRILPFPVGEGKYSQIHGVAKNKVLFTANPVTGSLNQSMVSDDPKGVLYSFDLSTKKQTRWCAAVNWLNVSADRKKLVLKSGEWLRVLKTSAKPDEAMDDEPIGRGSGWVDLDRVKLPINPADEWRQMYHEAWRLQRDHFWVEDMSGVDWSLVHDRYLPLVDRVASRSEFSDLIWEMQGELGTSHAYEIGGDYRPGPRYHQGFLGADISWDAKAAGYRIDKIIHGDPWVNGSGSALNLPGANIKKGDILRAIGGKKLTRRITPGQLLVNQAGEEILLTVKRGKSRPRQVTVKALYDDMAARYRQWVEENRAYVHKKTRNRIGYVHIPNMGPLGYAEFHRYYLAEVRHEGLIIDVRYNGGGHVSQLLLEKLMRTRIGYDVQRHFHLEPYPGDSVPGPKVALTNEFAGSDGDIFSHCFKLMNLGPLIGKRTWGGVIGIWPRHALADGSITTQPEYSFWFQDVGWQVENYGTDPDIEVDVLPQDDAANLDRQLDRSIAEAKLMLREQPTKLPKFNNKPKLTLPKSLKGNQ